MRDVLRPLPALGRRPGPFGLRVVLARRGDGHDGAALRRDLRAGLPLPPRHLGAGRGHAGGDVPEPLLAGPRQRPAPERGHHRRHLAREAGAQRPPARMRRRGPRLAARRDGQPPRPRHRRAGQALQPARRAAAPARRRGDGTNGRGGGRLGGRVADGLRRPRPDAQGGRSLPARRRRGQAAGGPGRPELGAHRRGGAGRRARAVAHQRHRRRGELGAAPARGVRPRHPLRPPGGHAGVGLDLLRPRLARGTDRGTRGARLRGDPTPPGRPQPAGLHRRVRGAGAAGPGRRR